MEFSDRIGRNVALFMIALGICVACGADDEPAAEASAAGAQAVTAGVNDARLRAADAEPGSWLAHGRTWDEQRFSPLDQLHVDNVANLQLRWSFATGTKRGLEATPIVVDGVMYTTGTWSVVYALDARDRSRDPVEATTPRSRSRPVGQKACCDVVNRGVAIYRGIGSTSARSTAAWWRSTRATGAVDLGGASYRRSNPAPTRSPGRRAS